MAGENRGKITQVIGAVLDIRFDEGKLPEINEAIRIPGVIICVFYHDLICVLKASVPFGSAEQAHFLSLSPSSFLEG